MEPTASRLRSYALFVLPGLFAGAAAVSGSFLAVGYTNEFIGGALATRILDILPPIVFGYGIVWLGGLAKPLLVANSILLAVIVITLGILGIQRVGQQYSFVLRSAGVFVFVAVLTGLISQSIGSAVGAGAAGSLAVLITEFDVGETEVSVVRRRVIRSAGVFVGTLGVGGVLATQRSRKPTSSDGSAVPGLDDERISELLSMAEERSFTLPDAEPLVSESFYRVDVNPVEYPKIQPSEWSIRIYGTVDRELQLDFSQITSLPIEHRFVTLRCVGDSLNGREIDNALWTGTPLAPLLDLAGAGENCCVGIEAADGYYQAFPRAALDNGFLAWGMNGEPLPGQHGAPIRVLIPGHWGEINVKWIGDIEIRTEPAVGYWEAQGWHGTGPVETVAKLHSIERDGEQVTIGGPAYAGVRGISGVEVSIDGGSTWKEAELTDELPGRVLVGEPIDLDRTAEDAWRLWRYSYSNPARHEVTVRAYERDGTRQIREEALAFPSGATGWVTGEIPPR